jgi:methyl-accepting chemotaxis protein
MLKRFLDGLLSIRLPKIRVKLFASKGLRFRFLASVLISALIIYSFIGIFLISRIRHQAITSAKTIGDGYSREYASLLAGEMKSNMYKIEGLIHVFKTNMNLPSNTRIEIYNNSLKSTLESSPELLSVWLSMQLSELDSSWHNQYGRRRITYYKVDNFNGKQEDFLDKEGFDFEGDYYKLMQAKNTEFSEPYYDSYGNSRKILMTSICVPLLDANSKFLGLAGIDLDLAKIQNFAKDINQYDNSYSIIISSNGTIVADKDSSNNGKPFESIYSTDNNKYSIISELQNGKSISYIGNIGGKKHYVSFTPISLGNSVKPWALATVIPMKAIYKSSNKTTFFSIFIAVLGCGILMLSTFLITDKLVKPLQDSIDFARNIGEGNLSNHLSYKRSDELGDLVLALDGMSQKLKDIVKSISGGSQQLTNMAKSLSGSSKQLLSASYRQYDSSDLVNKSILNLEEHIHKNNEFSMKAETVSKEAGRKIKQSVRLSVKAATSMSFISERISIINDIALQTNILA